MNVLNNCPLGNDNTLEDITHVILKCFVSTHVRSFLKYWGNIGTILKRAYVYNITILVLGMSRGYYIQGAFQDTQNV